MAKNDLTDYVVIDESTGEYKGNMTVSEVNTYFNGRTSAPRMNDKNKFKFLTDQEKDYIKHTFGTFFFNYYGKNGEFKYLFRFIYLCTYSNYKNYIEWGNNKEKLANKKDLQEILMLKNRQFYETFNYFINNKLLIEDNYFIGEEECFCYKINNKICNRGHMNLTNSKNGVIRIFDESIRSIYKESKSIQHERLGLFFKLLPQIHYDMNIICKNPTAITEEIQPYSLTELAEYLGYTTNKRLKSALFDIEIKGEKVIMISIINNKSMIFINPRIYYKGNNIKNIQFLQDIFDMSKKIKC